MLKGKKSNRCALRLLLPWLEQRKKAKGEEQTRIWPQGGDTDAGQAQGTRHKAQGIQAHSVMAVIYSVGDSYVHLLRVVS